MIGEKLPLFVTSLGRAYLAACDMEERAAILTLLSQRDDWIGVFARDQARVEELVDNTVRRGYATNDGESLRDPHFSSVAVPMFCGNRLLASLNLVFPKNAVEPAELERRYVPALKHLASTVGNLSRSWLEL